MASTREGLVVEARILTRCCFENSLWIGGLAGHGDEFVRAMFDDEARSRKVRGEFILREAYELDEKVEQRLRAQLRDINKRSPRTNRSAQKTWRKTVCCGMLTLSTANYLQMRVIPRFRR